MVLLQTHFQKFMQAIRSMDLTLHREEPVFTGEDSCLISIDPGLDITGEKIRLI